MRSSNLSQGIRESIRFRNTSRRVCRFLCWYSKSAKVGCSVMVAPPWYRLASVCHNHSIIQSFPSVLQSEPFYGAFWSGGALVSPV